MQQDGFVVFCKITGTQPGYPVLLPILNNHFTAEQNSILSSVVIADRKTLFHCNSQQPENNHQHH